MLDASESFDPDVVAGWTVAQMKAQLTFEWACRRQNGSLCTAHIQCVHCAQTAATHLAHNQTYRFTVRVGQLQSTPPL